MGHHGRVAGNSSKRGRQTVRDMILSMLAVGAVGAGAYVLIPHDTKGDRILPIDYSSSLASARRAAPYQLLGPADLPAGWKATSVEYKKDPAGHAVWHLGFETPSRQYAAIEQSDGARADVLKATVPGGQADGESKLGAQDWQRLQGERYRALTVQTGKATTVVTGTASYDELGVLAQSLK
ncbi:DUF4245 domain-containing protein [Kitasatospora sp. NPDC002227]|uniref:DUF4245 domain-containing protein n=1 Tax=Kitasatospora sp. NPDC002227 TaxID=3154773 RepID=UPI00332B2ADD